MKNAPNRTGLGETYNWLRCPICKKFFLTTNVRRQKYRTGIAPEEYGGLTCALVAKQTGRAYREQTETFKRNAEAFSNRKGPIIDSQPRKN